MKILITGTECTGKSTLAASLSKTLDCPWIPEYARTYLDTNGPEYTEQDLLYIAEGHHKLVCKYDAEQPLILDTYLLNLKIWSMVKFGNCNPWISNQLALAVENQIFDKVFLCAPDLPWKQDGLRENQKSADSLHQLFISELEILQLDYFVISGQGDQRMEPILAAIGH